ncbi:MAG: low molecular weight phosphatase family protein [Chloroflexi bacterium]|nr:low molecular weight phosphatase family protein [Chloroflexota bacterium]
MKRILFVDVRNATRSQIAEAWFNHLADASWQAQSCGTMPAHALDERAVQVMAEVGVDLRAGTPKRVSQQATARADIIVLMGKDIQPYAFNTARIWEFQDLSGESVEQVRFLRERIRARVQDLIAEIRLIEFESVNTASEWRALMACLANA